MFVVIIHLFILIMCIGFLFFLSRISKVTSWRIASHRMHSYFLILYGLITSVLDFLEQFFHFFHSLSWFSFSATYLVIRRLAFWVSRQCYLVCLCTLILECVYKHCTHLQQNYMQCVQLFCRYDICMSPSCKAGLSRGWHQWIHLIWTQPAFFCSYTESCVKMYTQFYYCYVNTTGQALWQTSILASCMHIFCSLVGCVGCAGLNKKGDSYLA